MYTLVGNVADPFWVAVAVAVAFVLAPAGRVCSRAVAPRSVKVEVELDLELIFTLP